MKILVVDDSATMRKMIVKTLAQEGWNDVVEAADGADALTKLMGVDLILTDSDMPVMDGFDFVKAVRGYPTMSATPIMMVAPATAQADVIEALKSGVNEYLIKPFSAPDLLERIRMLLEKSTH